MYIETIPTGSMKMSLLNDLFHIYHQFTKGSNCLTFWQTALEQFQVVVQLQHRCQSLLLLHGSW